MDLGEAMLIWKEELGGTITSWDKKDGYYCLFIKHNQVWGHTKASPGGIYWEWPNKLLEWRKKMDEMKIDKIQNKDKPLDPWGEHHSEDCNFDDNGEYLY
tara:strand:+ start:1107 stop:1406 length:300 start_codon:yes stop_codon:yes gene_type:complete